MWNDFEPKKVAIEIARKENSISSVSEFINFGRKICLWELENQLHVQFGFYINFCTLVFIMILSYCLCSDSQGSFLPDILSCTLSDRNKR